MKLLCQGLCNNFLSIHRQIIPDDKSHFLNKSRYGPHSRLIMKPSRGFLPVTHFPAA
jgi:hypothetical protein